MKIAQGGQKPVPQSGFEAACIFLTIPLKMATSALPLAVGSTVFIMATVTYYLRVMSRKPADRVILCLT